MLPPSLPLSDAIVRLSHAHPSRIVSNEALESRGSGPICPAIPCPAQVAQADEVAGHESLVHMKRGVEYLSTSRIPSLGSQPWSEVEVGVAHADSVSVNDISSGSPGTRDILGLHNQVNPTSLKQSVMETGRQACSTFLRLLDRWPTNYVQRGWPEAPRELARSRC